MKWIVLFIALFSFSQTFGADLNIGDQTATFNLTAGRDASRFIVLDPISGLDAAPFVLIPETVINDPQFLDVGVNAVPRNDELKSLLKLSDLDFRQGLESHIRFHGRDYVTLRGRMATPQEKAAWNVVNSNTKKNPEITVRLFSEWSAIDFEVSSFIGENGDRRANCFAGHKITLKYEIVAINFSGDRDLTAKAQAVVGTVFEYTYPYYVGRNFLTRKIDLGKEQGEAFRKECKAEKNKLQQK